MSQFTKVIQAAMNREVGEITYDTYGYITEGGTYIIAISGQWTDSGSPRDLLAILPGPPEVYRSRVVILRPTVNPQLVKDLRYHLEYKSR